MKSTVVYLKTHLWSPSATFGWSSPSTNKLTVIPRREWGFICFMSFAGRQFSWVPYLLFRRKPNTEFFCYSDWTVSPIPMLFLKCPQKCWLEKAHLTFVTAFPCSMGKRYMHGTCFESFTQWCLKKEEKEPKNSSAVSVTRRALWIFVCSSPSL